jgi:hypothetical protein
MAKSFDGRIGQSSRPGVSLKVSIHVPNGHAHAASGRTLASLMESTGFPSPAYRSLVVS